MSQLATPLILDSLEQRHPWAAFVEWAIDRAAARDETQSALAKRWGLSNESTLRNWTFRPSAMPTSPTIDEVFARMVRKMDGDERAEFSSRLFGRIERGLA